MANVPVPANHVADTATSSRGTRSPAASEPAHEVNVTGGPEPAGASEKVTSASATLDPEFQMVARKANGVPWAAEVPAPGASLTFTSLAEGTATDVAPAGTVRTTPNEPARTIASSPATRTRAPGNFRPLISRTPFTQDKPGEYHSEGQDGGAPPSR